MREMKDSEIEWIKAIPSNWKISKIDQLYIPRNTKVSDFDYQPLSVTMQGIVPQLETAAKTNAHDSRKLVMKGDFAINSRSDRRGSCGISEYTGSVSLINTVLRPKEDMNARYYNWLFHTSMFSDEFYRWGHGIVDDLWSTGWQEMKKISIPSPSLQEQQKIADFLDEKCAEIDALTSDIQTQIETLEEYKKSVITEAVTKGLDPNVEMKDSGIEWIGKIPKHWLTTKLKRFCYFKTGTTPKTSNPLWFDGSLKWYTPSDFSENYILEDSSRTLTYKAKQDNVATIIPKNTVIIIGIGGTAGKIGLTVEECSCNQQLTAIISQHVHHKYLMYWMVANSCFLKETALYTTLPIINNRTLAEYLLIFPEDLSEQIKISDYLDNKCIEIKKIISEKRQQLETLAEYKKSLIYEYVTGKKEVA